jgi:hypothetical protein
LLEYDRWRLCDAQLSILQHVFSILARRTAVDLRMLIELASRPPPTMPISSIALVNDPSNISLDERQTKAALGVLLTHHLATVSVPLDRVAAATTTSAVSLPTVPLTSRAEGESASKALKAKEDKKKDGKYMYSACVDEALTRTRHRSFVMSAHRIHGKLAAVVMDMLFLVRCCLFRARARVCVCVFVDVLLSASLGTALQLLRRGKRSDLCCRARLNDCFR